MSPSDGRRETSAKELEMIDKPKAITALGVAIVAANLDHPEKGPERPDLPPHGKVVAEQPPATLIVGLPESAGGAGLHGSEAISGQGVMTPGISVQL